MAQAQVVPVEFFWQHNLAAPPGDMTAQDLARKLNDAIPKKDTSGKRSGCPGIKNTSGN